MYDEGEERVRGGNAILPSDLGLSISRAASDAAFGVQIKVAVLGRVAASGTASAIFALSLGGRRSVDEALPGAGETRLALPTSGRGRCRRDHAHGWGWRGLTLLLTVRRRHR